METLHVFLPHADSAYLLSVITCGCISSACAVTADVWVELRLCIKAATVLAVFGDVFEEVFLDSIHVCHLKGKHF